MKFFKRGNKGAVTERINRPVIEENTPSEPEMWIEPKHLIAKQFYWDMQEQAHFLIGGTTGSGKSNVLNGFIRSMLRYNPNTVQFILIDPKRTELKKYKKLPHTLRYANEKPEIEEAINYAHSTMFERNKSLDDDLLATSYDGSDIWVIIDEYAVLPEIVSKSTIAKLNDIASLGRASKVHIVFCTQRPTQDVITGMIKANVTATLALKTATPQESRNLIQVAGCENLPKYGEGFYRTSTYAGELGKFDIPYSDPEEIWALCQFWMNQHVPESQVDTMYTFMDKLEEDTELTFLDKLNKINEELTK